MDILPVLLVETLPDMESSPSFLSLFSGVAYFCCPEQLFLK